MDMFQKETTSAGNVYGLCVLDLFSKYLWVKAIPTKEAKWVTAFMATIVEEHGWFPKLQTDNALEFIGHELSVFCKERRIGIC